MTPLELAALDTSKQAAKTLLGKILGPAADEIGLQLADNMKIRRLNNQIKNLKRVQDIVVENNITTRDVNLKVLFPYLESISLEEEEPLQEMWANLFVNYLDVTKNLKITVYPSILGQLSSDEIKILNYMMDYSRLLNLMPIESIENIEWDWDSVNNLERLGLIENIPDFTASGRVHDDSYAISRNDLTIEQEASYRYWLTEFGKRFIEACRS
jgi:hypothetical protein